MADVQNKLEEGAKYLEPGEHFVGGTLGIKPGSGIEMPLIVGGAALSGMSFAIDSVAATYVGLIMVVIGAVLKSREARKDAGPKGSLASQIRGDQFWISATDRQRLVLMPFSKFGGAPRDIEASIPADRISSYSVHPQSKSTSFAINFVDNSTARFSVPNSRKPEALIHGLESLVPARPV